MKKKVNYGSWEQKMSFLYNDFALNLAKAWFDLAEESLEEMFGRYTKGKRKGKLRGAIKWKKISKPGWFRDCNGNGFVCSSNKVIFNKELVLPQWKDPDIVKMRVGDFSNCPESDLRIAYEKMIENINKNKGGNNAS